MVLVGLPKGPIQLDDPVPRVIQKAITLHTIHGRKIWSTWQQCEELISKKLASVHKYHYSKG